jgi:hypothetical protein
MEGEVAMKTRWIFVLGAVAATTFVAACSSSSDTGTGLGGVGTGGSGTGGVSIGSGGQGAATTGGSGTASGGAATGGSSGSGGAIGTTGGTSSAGGASACPGTASSGGAGGAGGATSGSEKDVAGSAECKAWCDRLHADCPAFTCDPAFDCAIKAGDCAASEKAFLACQAQTGQFVCGTDGYSVLHGCKRNPAVCSGGGTGGGVSKPTCTGIPAAAPSGGSCYQGGACNPVTNAGCQGTGSCDLSDQGFACFEAGTVDPCGACNAASGPFCSKGNTCLDTTCAHYCCTDADCGCGKCTDQMQGTQLIHVCMN